MAEKTQASWQPTAEMATFFQRRTDEHIGRVRTCLFLAAQVFPEHAAELALRAAVHDASKFSEAEREPYIWLTEFHRCRQTREPFEYPSGMEARVKTAVRHHVKSNRHHPEFHADPNDMTEVDLIEMVCDWTAMSQEFSQDGGSARGWADKSVGSRVKFDSRRRDFIYRTIELLDAKIAANS